MLGRVQLVLRETFLLLVTVIVKWKIIITVIVVCKFEKPETG
jgi:hypothetical protein